MSVFTAQIIRVSTNGPFAYVLYKDGAGQKSANSLANVGAAMNAVRDDIAGLLGTQTVDRVALEVRAS